MQMVLEEAIVTVRTTERSKCTCKSGLAPGRGDVGRNQSQGHALRNSALELLGTEFTCVL